MVRFTLYLVLSLAAVVAAAIWFSDRPGTVAVEWQGYLIEMSVGRFILAAAVVVWLLATIAGLVRTVGRVPRRFREGRQASRRERGYRALTQGMVAVAAGDANEANRQARRADVLLNEPPLTMLLSAQAAQLNGDEAAAKRYFTAMLDRPETAFLGVRGLLMQAQRDNDRPAALDYARRAYELQPRTPWVLTTMFDLQVREGNWAAALTTLEEAIKRKAVSAADARDRHAAVLIGCSRQAEDDGDFAAALRYAKRAQALAPDYLPADLRAVDLLIRAEKPGQAGRLIQTVWALAPHPELARLYGVLAGTDDPLKKVRRFEKLLSFNPAHEESHLALAQAALDAELWGEARNHLEKAVAGTPSARACRMMAELEEHEFGNTDTARDWLLRASTAAPDPVWLCAECGAAAAAWTPLCPHCGALGAQGWTSPPRATPPAAMVAGATAAADEGVSPPADPAAPPDGGLAIDGETRVDVLPPDPPASAPPAPPPRV